MTEIEAIYEKFLSEIKSKSPKEYIEFYKVNNDIIESGDTSLGSIDYNNIVSLTAEYALALSYYGSSRKALIYLDKAIKLIENATTGDLSKDNTYEILALTRGHENFNQKNYLEATKDYKYLAENYPDNDKYKKWLSNSYEEFHWARASANYKQKKYSEAERDFRYLVENYPDNETYKNCLIASLTIRSEWITNLALSGIVFSFTVSIFAKSKGTKLYADIFSLAFLLLYVCKALWNYSVKSEIKQR